MFEIIAENICKEYAELTVLRNINFKVQEGECLAVTGPNGSGKTTLIRILSNLIRPSAGAVIYQNNGQKIKDEEKYKYIGLTGPYLELYEDLTARENLDFFAGMRRLENSSAAITELTARLGLQGREGDTVKTYSSGMKQRLKYVFALLGNPKVLFVDEPRSNLDEEGIEKITAILADFKKKGLLILATNDKDDLQLADQIVSVDG